MGTEPKAYRIFYRGRDSYNHREEVVYGEAELARCLKRQRPAAIHHEPAILWRCDICKARGPWTRQWRLLPRLTPEGRPDYGQQHVAVCSDACSERHWPGQAARRIAPKDDHEPSVRLRDQGKHQKRLRARWAAFSAERERKAALRDHRKVPMFHEKKPEGFCRWCGEPVGKGRRTWHPDCVRTYFLHSDAAAQLRHLVKRDGPTCKAEGCHQRGTDVDHVTPLWSVRDLPDQERLRFYGPDNLQLLCGDCHREKTGREAGERAAGKASKQDS